MAKGNKAKKANVKRINELEFMMDQVLAGMSNFGNQLVQTSQILAQYVAVGDLLVKKELLTDKEIQARLIELQEQALSGLKDVEDGGEA